MLQYVKIYNIRQKGQIMHGKHNIVEMDKI